jgi:hypothetical protein
LIDLTSIIPKGYVDNKNINNNQQIIKNRTLDKRNPPPLTVSCAPSGDEGLTVYIQTKEKKQSKRLDRASVRDPSFNLPQGEVDNCLRIN